MTGLSDTTLQMVGNIRARTGATAMTTVAITIDPAALLRIDLRCGLLGTSDGMGAVDTWVDHVTMDVCH